MPEKTEIDEFVEDLVNILKEILPPAGQDDLYEAYDKYFESRAKSTPKDES